VYDRFSVSPETEITGCSKSLPKRALRCLRIEPEARETVYDSFSMSPENDDFRVLEELA